MTITQCRRYRNIPGASSQSAWLLNEKGMARNSVNLQVRECVKKFEIDEENSDVDLLGVGERSTTMLASIVVERSPTPKRSKVQFRHPTLAGVLGRMV